MYPVGFKYLHRWKLDGNYIDGNNLSGHPMALTPISVKIFHAFRWYFQKMAFSIVVAESLEQGNSLHLLLSHFLKLLSP